jgi:hypothetical protein
VRRLTIPVIVFLTVVCWNANSTFAQNEARTLHQAVIDGNIDKVKSLLANGTDINVTNMLGGTPLHTAISNKQQAIAEFLISKGPDLNARDKQGRTPLFLAVETDQKSIVNLLLTKNVDVNVVGRGGQNALSLAKSKGDTELTELLVKHGATDPVLGMEDDMYPGGRGAGRGNANAAGAGRMQPAAAQRPGADLSILSDPNEIRARIKTFAGLEKVLKDVESKSSNEERQWIQTRSDNRGQLQRAVEKQFEDEMAVVKTIATEEKAQKTVAAIDALLAQKKDRARQISRELLQQRREQAQEDSTRARGRGRTSSRGTRGRSSMRNQYAGADTADSLYEGAGTTGRTGRGERSTRPQEQLDPQTEQEIRLWTQASPEQKNDLAKSVNDQLLAEIGSIRTIAVEEKAKKTTAALDGIMLAHQERFTATLKKMEEEQRKAEERQQRLDARERSRGNSRYQDGSTQQQDTQRSRGRRR